MKQHNWLERNKKLKMKFTLSKDNLNHYRKSLYLHRKKELNDLKKQNDEFINTFVDLLLEKNDQLIY